MSEELKELEGLDGEERKSKLKEMIDKGIDPTKNEPEVIDTKDTTDLVITEEQRKLNQENFDNLIGKYESLVERSLKKDVDLERGKLLGEIQILDEESYQEEKENHSLNELQAVLRGLKRGKPRESKRDVGAKDKDGSDEDPPTQWSHLKNKFVSG